MIAPHAGVAEIRTYLQRNGWQQAEASRVAQFWRHGDHEVLVPVIETAPDFERRLEILAKDLAQVEDRSPASIRTEIGRQFVDLTEIRAMHGYGDDFIALEASQRIFDSTKRMVVAGAAATLRRTGYFGKRIPTKARAHARSVVVGHTYPGSYVIPIFSQARLPNLPWQGDNPHLVMEVEAAAFDRRVATTLAQALGVLQQLVVDRPSTPSNREINDGVGEGISYELCESIRSALVDPAVEQLEINFKWAPAVTAPRGVGQSVGFPVESRPVLEHIAAGLRQDRVNRQQLIYGVVVTLSSLSDEEGGRVIIHALIDGRRQTIRLELNPSQYEIAVACHKHTPVLVRGVLHQDAGRMATMDVEAFEPDPSLPLT